RDERVREAEPHVADGGVSNRPAARERARPRAGLDEGDRETEIELETVRDSVREEEVRVDLMIDGVLRGPGAPGGGAVQDDRPRLVRRDEAEADLPPGDRLRAAYGGEALRSGVRPVAVA